MANIKSLFLKHGIFLSILPLLLLGACSTNPATGEKQFTALMSPQQEVQVGASEHEKIVQQFGLEKDPQINSYVSEIGKRVSAETERPDVQYKFFVLDSPIVNAFALPGGYIYISRGLLALANNEAEVAAVLAHETGHITGRHSAERYSRGVVTTLGAGLLGAVLESDGAAQALGTGANLYLSSYSRGQENEADTLGLRYMTRGQYNPNAMSSFLYSLQRQSDLDAKVAGRSSTSAFSYFSTHPATGERVSKTRAEAQAYAQTGEVGRDDHLNTIAGMTYGDSAEQGFARGNRFYHPALGFTFEVPEGFAITNQPSQVVATSAQTGSAIIFDMAASQGMAPANYVQNWVKDRNLQDIESITVNGMPAATGSFSGIVQGRATTIRLVAIRYGDKFVRFQIAIPQNAPASLVTALKQTTYSFRSLSQSERGSVRPLSIKLFTARGGDTVVSRAQQSGFDDYKAERFRVLNGLAPNEELQSGVLYKTVQ
ncbi:MAG: M48 family metalloprotease [Alphaproteobacteria bacterium]|nr:M48 family metalloprotease [Alphaproteobacteria bacterium]